MGDQVDEVGGVEDVSKIRRDDGATRRRRQPVSKIKSLGKKKEVEKRINDSQEGNIRPSPTMEGKWKDKKL